MHASIITLHCMSRLAEILMIFGEVLSIRLYRTWSGAGSTIVFKVKGANQCTFTDMNYNCKISLLTSNSTSNLFILSVAQFNFSNSI